MAATGPTAAMNGLRGFRQHITASISPSSTLPPSLKLRRTQSGTLPLLAPYAPSAGLRSPMEVRLSHAHISCVYWHCLGDVDFNRWFYSFTLSFPRRREPRLATVFPGDDSMFVVRVRIGECVQNGPLRDGVLEGIRTPDPRFRKPVLYPAELPGRVGHFIHRPTGLRNLYAVGMDGA
jgi:hypothetical protein